MSVEESDLKLVERVQRGERAAFDLLVLRYQHKVLKLIMRYVHDATEAEDIAQEAFVKAYRALQSFRGDSAFYTWLYRIAINTAKNALVATKRRPMDYDLDLQDPEQYDLHSRLAEPETWAPLWRVAAACVPMAVVVLVVSNLSGSTSIPGLLARVVGAVVAGGLTFGAVVIWLGRRHDTHRRPGPPPRPSPPRPPPRPTGSGPLRVTRGA